MKHYSDNIIFFDTEFTHLDVNKGELLSIGLLKQSGEELYLELEYEGKEVHPWVEDHVLPFLIGEKIKKEDARMKLWEFVGEDKPYLMAYVNQFDAIYWYRLFADPKDHPAFWIPIDFASILFAHGRDPEEMRKDSFFEELGLDRTKYDHHNALEDAKMLKDAYNEFVKII
ncbi:hypothetical protein HN481_00790 [Candidatus Parcubacteria bacterium]|jgi:DNA polymerase III epsilon subunit-like protein|nr:hypothetical protein [Candidatus Parcubacteria bacterium]